MKLKKWQYHSKKTSSKSFCVIKDKTQRTYLTRVAGSNYIAYDAVMNGIVRKATKFAFLSIFTPKAQK